MSTAANTLSPTPEVPLFKLTRLQRLGRSIYLLALDLQAVDKPLDREQITRSMSDVIDNYCGYREDIEITEVT